MSLSSSRGQCQSHAKRVWATLCYKKNHATIVCNIKIYTAPWGCWKHPNHVLGSRPMFLKAELHKEYKNEFKTINSCPYPVLLFSKNWFQHKKKSSKKLDLLLIFEFLCQYILRPVLKNLIVGVLESVEILTKFWKLFNFFTCDFLFLKISCFIGIIATIGFYRPQTPDF